MKHYFMKFMGIFSNFKGDMFGGITAGVIALPLALAFGVVSGVGATAGLYGAILVGLFALIFGGTKSQISGPTGPMTVVLASIVATNPGNYKLIFATILLAGLFQILPRLSKVGRFIKNVPYPVISGFMSGIGVIIIILQLNPLLGLDIQGSPIKTILGIGEIFSSFNLQSLILGILTLVIVFYTTKKISHDSNKELVGQGIGNMFSGLFGGIAGAGAIMRTVVNIKSGGFSINNRKG